MIYTYFAQRPQRLAPAQPGRWPVFCTCLLRAAVARPWLIGCLLAFAGLSQLRAQDAGLFVARGGVEIAGVVEGSVEISGDGAITVHRGASISGDARLSKASPSGGSGKDEDVQTTRLHNSGGADTLRGSIGLVDAYELPQVMAPVVPGMAKTLLVRDINPVATTFLGAADISVDLRDTLGAVTLPAGAYRDCSVEKGILKLGLPDTREPVRYSFKKLDVKKDGRVRVVGPVVIILAEGGEWHGGLGENDKPLWLEVRVASGDVRVEKGCEFHGCLNAPESRVKIGAGALLSGGLVADTVTVDADGKVATHNPNWSGAAERGDQPTFTHRAIRLQQQVPALKKTLRSTYFPAVGYVEDTPYMMLVERSGAEALPTGSTENALFESFVVLFANGFRSAGLVLIRSDAADPSGQSKARNIFIRVDDFERVLKEVGSKNTTSANIAVIRGNEELIARFAEHCFAGAQAVKPQ